MAVKRIIPCLDVDNGRVVKGKKFLDITDVADPVSSAKRYNDAGADELVFYDITASTDSRPTFLSVAQQIAAVITIPFTIGGGIRSLNNIQEALDAGADKVSINSAAVGNPSLIKEAAERFGSQRVVLSIDAKKMKEGQWDVYINGGQEPAGMDVIEWAKKGEALGAGEIVLNAINEDGAKNGYDLELIEATAASVSIPIIASGGAGTIDHFVEVLQPGRADAALGASVFHYNEIDMHELKTALTANGVEIRRPLS
ncbi:Imidazole glycerol phosphate synthase subunit HisF [Lentibacillus sp. JNUCC-1]|uniref:imidazole glycerol phosphate synthase subunit HisF n=1 Tax=Lentibacillus sp. JNUCC-1 TaxID=2654513 RepID=UPI0012E858CE|nr:imidazole glycerol phosphate synthase subunit HisF [Lentibacillus sp. JNUCC-1]MUV38617.1 Imidazole glycerol phosphate synthase subunit HisF [Lentibacillus sp. JNUCC-1]